MLLTGVPLHLTGTRQVSTCKAACCARPSPLGQGQEQLDTGNMDPSRCHTSMSSHGGAQHAMMDAEKNGLN